LFVFLPLVVSKLIRWKRPLTSLTDNKEVMRLYYSARSVMQASGL